MLTKNCSWCGDDIVRPGDSYAGSGPDLLCSNECSKLYWRDLDRVMADIRWAGPDQQTLFDETNFFDEE